MTPPCAFEQPESAVATILDRHARQRADDHPAVSVLVGDVSMCGHDGNRWAASQGQGVVEVDAPCSGPAVAWVAAALLRQRDLVVDALGELSRRTGRPQHVLQAEGAARTGSERSLWLDRLGGCDGAGDVDRLCRAVLTQWGTETFDVEERGRFPTPQESVEWPPARLLGTMSRLIPAAELPAVAFVWRDDSCDRLADTAEELFLLAGAAPRIPMALLMPPAARPVLVAVENNARAMAFLREGLIERDESSDHGAGVVVRDQVDFPDLLKRARSAGISLFLATQSPGDLDYKCRDNIRNWFVGCVK